ncbi:MAG TPA: hypothetical protein RMF84_02245 [Polyangiaceae bacterium LLY-WYZ-14_1]|nr:hypothetical protein [Polyangiaceae bacterium LLY-WYZ-14_1]
MTTETVTRAQATAWHTRNWDTLGWLETLAKGVGIGAALAGAFIAGAAPIAVSGVGIAAAAVAGLLALAAIVQLLLRVKQRELISLAFAIANLLGAAALLQVVLTAPAMAWVPTTFGGAYLVGELIKQRFLAQSGYTEDGQTTRQMQRTSQVLAGLHLVLVLATLLR